MDILKLIESQYADFGDALITNVEYFSGYNFENKSINKEEITITISCFNINKSFGESNELISLKCSEISYLNLKKYNGMIYQALLEKKENEYIIDFFPELIGKEDGNGLNSKQNYDSICIVKCKQIDFKLISESKPVANRVDCPARLEQGEPPPQADTSHTTESRKLSGGHVLGGSQRDGLS